MKKLVYLFLFISTAISINAQDLSYLRKYAGGPSSKVINDSLLNPMIRKLLGNEYKHFTDNLTLSHQINLIDNDIVIQGYANRTGESEPCILVIEINWKKIYAAIGSESKITIYADNIEPDNYGRLPESIKEWISTYNLNQFIRPQIPKNVTLFYSKEQKLTKDRDGIIEDLNNLGAIAQQYYRKPKIKSGGGNSFMGWQIPARVETTPNGKYSAIVNDQKVVITGIGNAKKNNVFIQHSATISPTTIEIKKEN
ncbi:MAG: hypothetical protein P4L27_14395 [Ignavibacteriaceae bacterium]|nr:hypothetical protein [Ignavibacteriaceae bacterium]